ncbi:hypothetical protein [Spiroplasma turonicum]|uniref:Uncharacterized protein n=1 Tax=Spiroplasma turonicum TaxID=216946 RepID=A0A0K1P6Y5_9MOLU|nr:hypothetical protein [Spiroplasma turonicum]AKU80035.1 hypothetical protein STURON_00789 [Spiroplasma turonicum]ALX71037.1 hypothetical protein STURO_v1c07860 [Spiroplasma turonicum]
MSELMTPAIIGVVIVIVLIFIVVSSITSKKAQKVEQQKRKKIVREEIKSYLSKSNNLKNVKLEYEKVYARKGPEYKYRDVFDVVVNIFEAKTNKLMATRSFEVEGITTKEGKKNYTTTWQVNKELELEDTRKRIAIAEKKVKLTKEEKKVLKEEEKLRLVEQKTQMKEELKTLKEVNSKQKNDLESKHQIDKAIKDTTVKFIPRRNK